MSRVVHRQPVWTWSLVLFSALLLTPSTAALVLSALRQANVAVAPSAETVVAPRRATAEEEDAIKAAAESGRLKIVRLEPAASTLAVLTPSCVTVALLDTLISRARPRAPTTALRDRVVRGTGTRAPPVA